jgi:hypothetical protein
MTLKEKWVIFNIRKENKGGQQNEIQTNLQMEISHR